MTATQPTGLTPDQMELVLRGLRFVRSSISMELLDPSDAEAARRSERLRQVDGLVRQFTGMTERMPAGV